MTAFFQPTKNIRIKLKFNTKPSHAQCPVLVALAHWSVEIVRQ